MTTNIIRIVAFFALLPIMLLGAVWFHIRLALNVGWEESGRFWRNTYYNPIRRFSSRGSLDE